MPEIVKTLESVMIAGKHFDKGVVVECDDADAAILLNIKRAVKATPEDIRDYLKEAKKNTVAKQAPREIGEADVAGEAVTAPEATTSTDKAPEEKPRARNR